VAAVLATLQSVALLARLQVRLRAGSAHGRPQRPQSSSASGFDRRRFGIFDLHPMRGTARTSRGRFEALVAAIRRASSGVSNLAADHL
jgi:hypothetical protein